MKDLSTLHRIESIPQRQAALREFLQAHDVPVTPDDPIFDFGGLAPDAYARSCESLVGHVSIPVGIVGPLDVQVQDYAEDAAAELVEHGNRRALAVPIPMATHEGGLNASLSRGIKAANRCGGVQTWVLKASMTRGSCWVFETTEQAYRFSRWISTQGDGMRSWLLDPQNPMRDVEMGGVPVLSRYARLKAVHPYVVSNACHVVFEYATGDACGQNMTTRNTFLLHSQYILPRFSAEAGIAPAHFFLEANTGGDKKVSHLHHIAGGHGRTVLASFVLTEEVAQSVLECSIDDLLKLREIAARGARSPACWGCRSIR